MSGCQCSFVKLQESSKQRLLSIRHSSLRPDKMPSQAFSSLLDTIAQCPKKVSFNIASEASYASKVELKMPKIVNLASLWKPDVCSQTVLPNRLILIWQIMVENAKIEKLKWDILDDFETMWVVECLFCLKKKYYLRKSRALHFKEV